MVPLDQTPPGVKLAKVVVSPAHTSAVPVIAFTTGNALTVKFDVSPEDGNIVQSIAITVIVVDPAPTSAEVVNEPEPLGPPVNDMYDV